MKVEPKIEGAIIFGGYVNTLAVARGFVNKGLKVIVINEDKLQLANFSKEVKFVKSPKISNTSSFLSFLSGLPSVYSRRNYLLIPTCDEGVKLLSKNQAILGKKFRLLIDKNQQTIKKIQDKLELFKFIQSLKINVPKFVTVANKTDLNKVKSFKFPVIIKSRFPHEYRLKKIKIIAENFKSATHESQKLPEKLTREGVIIQEFYLLPEQVSFCSYSYQGKILTFFMTKKIRSRPRKTGTFTIVESIYSKKLYQLSKKIISRLRYNGISEIEFLRGTRENQYEFIEINPRFWMQHGLAEKIGIDLIEPIIKDYKSRKFKKNSYKLGVKWIHFYSDLYQALVDIKNGEFSLPDYINGFRGEKCLAVFSLKDPLPFIIETFQAFREVFYVILRKKR